MLKTIIRKIYFLTFFLLFLIYSNACKEKSLNDHFLKGPYVQCVTQNSITIMWESKDPTIGKVTFGKNSTLDQEITESDPTTIHEIILNGLEPESNYQYSVKSGNFSSDTYTFQTAVTKDTPFSFIVYGDNKNGPFVHERNANLILTKNPDFVLHNGDLVSEGNVYKEWELLFFYPTRNLMHSIPLYPVLGNHERHAKHYYNFFSLPNNESYYSFDYGNAHFIVLDSDADSIQEGSLQIRWLVEDLKSKNTTWTFVNFHHPLFAGGKNYYSATRIYLKNLLHPIFEKYDVDMVFNGHDHYYERTFPVMHKEGRKPITYVVAGNGGTPMRYVQPRMWTHYTERVFGFVQISIDGSKLNCKSFNIDDEIIDAFSIDKGDEKSCAEYRQRMVYFEDIVDPVEAIELYQEADDLLDENNFQEALDLFKKTYQVDTTCIVALGGIAECYYNLGNKEKAVQFARKAIAKMPNIPNGYEVLIDIYVKEEKYDQAVDWAQKWLLIEPDNSDPNETLAKIYEKQGQYHLAIEEMKKALDIVPSDADLHFLIGHYYAKIEDKNNAKAAYIKGLAWYMEEEENEDIINVRTKLAEWSE